jgi:mono/diheme cytochrome c family protein
MARTVGQGLVGDSFRLVVAKAGVRGRSPDRLPENRQVERRSPRILQTSRADRLGGSTDEYRSADSAAELPGAAYQDTRLVAAGRAVFERRGCVSCHQLWSVHDSGKIGLSLAGIADRDPDELPYGGNIVRHTTDNYIFLKVLLPDALGQPSLMPTFGLAPADAARIALALSSVRKAELPASYVLRRPAPAPYRPGGRFGELVSRYRCLSCHSVGGFGGDLSTVPLDRIGSQLQRGYLAQYLLNPGAVRVSVEARMPVFHMSPDEANTIADYLSQVFLDDSLDRYDTRFTAQESGRGRQLYEQLGCQACHQLGTTGGYVGPELSMTGTRLKPGWIAAWLSHPQQYRGGHTAARLRAVSGGRASVDGVPQYLDWRRCRKACRVCAMKQRRWQAIILTALALTALAGCRRGVRPQPGDPLLDAIRAEERDASLTYVESQGRRLFLHYCATCHGDDGAGQARTLRT